MEVDPAEVVRHLNVLGYTDIEPGLLNEFIKDLKKLIAYDRRHGYDVGMLSSTLHNEDRRGDQTYSDRMKSNAAVDDNGSTERDLFADVAEEFELNENENRDWRTSSKIANERDDRRRIKNNIKCEPNCCTRPKCYFCEYIPTKSRQRAKAKRSPSYAVHIGATFGVEL